MEKLRVDGGFAHSEVLAQENLVNNEVPFRKAAGVAMEQFLTNFDNGDESPLDVAYDFIYPEPALRLDAVSSRRSHKEFLRNLINNERSSISLYSLDGERFDSEASGEEAWIFRLYIAGLSDHAYLVEVPRALSKSGEVEARLYGRN